ncbi:unnamed protein product [Scytosiphon promiscuus]
MNTITAFPGATPVIEMTEPSRREQTVSAPDPHSPRPSNPTQEGKDEGDDVPRLSWKYAIWGWVFLATEVAAMAALYQRGEGRTARNIYIFGICEIFGCDKDAFSDTSVFSDSGEVSSDSSADEDQCTIGEGPPYLAEVLVLRAAIAVLTQMLAFCRPNACLWIPHKATFVFMYRLFECCNTGRMESQDAFDRDSQVRTTWVNTRTGQTERTEWGTDARYLHCFCIALHVVVPTAVLFLYSWYPAYCGIQAVCGLVTHATFGLGFAICALVCSFCCAVGGARNEDYDEEDAKNLQTFVVLIVLILDSFLVGIFFVWGNFVQSGFAAFVFALVPAFNLFVLLSGPFIGFR